MVDEAEAPLADDWVAVPDYKQAGTTQVDLDGLLAPPLKLHEDVKNGCGGQLWPAGMVLARHLLRHGQKALSNARVLELGAGGGLVGLAVARGCAVRPPVFMTDQAGMEALMRHNTALNRLDGRVEVRVLNWGDALPRDIVDFRPDVILAADCVYLEPTFPLLLRTLQDLLALSPKATVYFCFKKRRRADMHFLRHARKAFRVTEVPDDDRAVFSRQRLHLFTFTLTPPQGRGPPVPVPVADGSGLGPGVTS